MAFQPLKLLSKTLGESVVNPIKQLSPCDSVFWTTGGFSILSFLKNESPKHTIGKCSTGC